MGAKQKCNSPCAITFRVQGLALVAMHVQWSQREETAMKRFERLFCLSLLGVFAYPASGADQTWTGQISDSKCGGSHDQMITGRFKDLRTDSGAPARDCTLACIAAGGKFIFVTNGQIYKIANQNLAELRERAGTFVQLTGDLQGDTITVSGIAQSASK